MDGLSDPESVGMTRQQQHTDAPCRERNPDPYQLVDRPLDPLMVSGVEFVREARPERRQNDIESNGSDAEVLDGNVVGRDFAWVI